MRQNPQPEAALGTLFYAPAGQFPIELTDAQESFR